MNILIPSTYYPSFTDGEIVPIDSSDDEAYWRFWRDVWKRQRTVIVVEHDVVPATIALRSLWSCPIGWCTQPYTYDRMSHYRGLGCVKFTSNIMGIYPDLWEWIAEKSDYDHPPKHWCRLSANLTEMLTSLGVTRHDHFMAARHPIREGSAHGCNQI